MPIQDFVEHCDGDPVRTMQIPHRGIPSCLDNTNHCVVVFMEQCGILFGENPITNVQSRDQFTQKPMTSGHEFCFRG
eukprot:3353888-Lingulodinium_polyedra.AAC.1